MEDDDNNSVEAEGEEPAIDDEEEQIEVEEEEPAGEDEEEEQLEEESDEEEETPARPGPDTFAMTDRPGYEHGADDAVEEIYIVPDDKRRSSSVLSLFEFTEIISVRAAQISRGGANAAMIDIPDGITRSRDIAILELMARRCPLKVMRNMGRDVLPNGKIKKYVEQWSPNDMTHPTI